MKPINSGNVCIQRIGTYLATLTFVLEIVTLTIYLGGMNRYGTYTPW